MSEVTREHLIKQYNKKQTTFNTLLENDLCVRENITADEYDKIRYDVIRRFDELQHVMNSIIELDSKEEEYFLPTGKKIEHLITNDFINTYGPVNPNSSSDSLEQRIIGAKLIIKSLID